MRDAIGCLHRGLLGSAAGPTEAAIGVPSRYSVAHNLLSAGSEVFASAHPAARQRSSGRRRGRPSVALGRPSVGRRRQGEQEGGAGAGVVDRPDPPAQPLDDAAADGQAEPGPALLPGVGGVHLLESGEDPVQLVLRNPPAVVADGELDEGAPGLGPDRDDAAAMGELDRVAQQVEQRLDDPVRVGVDLTLGTADADAYARLLAR